MNRKKLSVQRFLLLLWILLYSQLSFSQFNLNEKLAVDPAVKIGKLPNGLTYYIRKNALPAKKVQLRLVVNAGSVLEDSDQQGLAHMMEHMNFNGLKHFPKNELESYLQSIGVQFGADLNAYTGFDETVFILPIPTDNQDKIEKGFTILEDWAGNALLDTTEINKERGVVLEESRLGKGAGERMSKKFYPVLFNGSTYAKRLPIGKDSIIQNFNAGSLAPDGSNCGRGYRPRSGRTGNYSTLQQFEKSCQ
jgi:zinc protease